MTDAKSQVIDKTRVMRRRDIKKCCRCGLGLMACRMPVFNRVTIEPMIVDVKAVQRAHGLEEMFNGNAILAAVMGPDEPLALPVGNARKVLLCGKCTLDFNLSFGELAEAAAKEEREGHKVDK